MEIITFVKIIENKINKMIWIPRTYQIIHLSTILIK